MGSRSLPALLLLATACHAAPAGNSGFGSTPGVTTASAPSTDETSSGTDSSASGGTTSADGNSTGMSTGSTGAVETTSPVLDVGSIVDVGDGKPAGCKGKIDFLFVISRDYSMKLVQTQLIKAFPDFIAAIQKKFADFDYHIMVIDGEPEWGLPYCTDDCPKPFDQCGVDDYPCDLLGLVTECDQILGAGNVFPAGGSAANKPCGLDGEQRFLTREQGDLSETFGCIAQLGVSGRRWLGEALTAAVSPQLNWQGACNEGFLREDALLMVTLVSAQWDEEGKPNGSAGTPEEWYAAVLAAKRGEPDAVVMLDIGDRECPWWDRLCALTKMFPHSLVTDAADPDYGDAFDKATDLVEDACAGFVPPG